MIKEQIVRIETDGDETKAEVVGEIVRCKDCKHRPTGTGEDHDIEFPDNRCPCQCEDYWYSWKPSDDWFCANGERKETEVMYYPQVDGITPTVIRKEPEDANNNQI